MATERPQTMVGSLTPQWLVLDDLEPDPDVVRRLARNLAFRHLALPVAEEERRLTVAMADPTDSVARKAVTAALGTEPCVVQGDVLAIDVVLSQIWNERVQSWAGRLASLSVDPSADPEDPYAGYVADLLAAELAHLPPQLPFDTLAQRAWGECELVIYGELDRSCDDALRWNGVLRRAIDGLPTSLLVAKGPRKPLLRLLLVIQGAAPDHKAIDWALRLSRSSGAVVTALAIVPPVSGARHGLSRFESGLAELLRTDTVLGRQMRCVARRLAEADIPCTVRLRQGPAVGEIHREAMEGDHDMVIVAIAPSGTTGSWRFNERPVSLLRIADRPVLIAR